MAKYIKFFIIRQTELITENFLAQMKQRKLYCNIIKIQHTIE